MEEQKEVVGSGPEIKTKRKIGNLINATSEAMKYL
jgi:hypothetical protein